MENKILIIDDDHLVGISLQKILKRFQYDAIVCTDGGDTFKYIADYQPDIILLDIYLKDYNGLEILKQLRKKHVDIPVIMITAYSDVKMAVSALKTGAYDFLLKPIDIDQLQIVLEKCVANKNLINELEIYKTLLAEDKIEKDFFGKSKQMQSILRTVERLSKSDDTTILLQGESGTGKEIIAKYIHQISKRSGHPFITINCGAIPKELAESELFGHEKGAFTGAAAKTHLGKFELAEGGTILLDEIGELSLELQVKLLRVLQERTFYRLGGEKEIKVNVRVLAATNRNMEDEVTAGNFREDLYYRLNVASVTVPPLRERKGDIPFLTLRFINEFADKFDIKVNHIEPEVMQLLEKQVWKGNVRELRNAVERALLMVDGNEIKIHHFNFLEKFEEVNKKVSSKGGYQLFIPPKGIPINIVLKDLIQQTLKITKGNQVQAAKILGLSRSKLRYRMEQLGIEVTKNID